jgi:hypothetical protein
VPSDAPAEKRRKAPAADDEPHTAPAKSRTLRRGTPRAERLPPNEPLDADGAPPDADHEPPDADHDS